MNTLRDEVEQEFASAAALGEEYFSPASGYSTRGIRHDWNAYYEMKRRVVEDALKTYGSMNKAAKMLGISRTTLYNWKRRNGIQGHDKGRRAIEMR